MGGPGRQGCAEQRGDRGHGSPRVAPPLSLMVYTTMVLARWWRWRRGPGRGRGLALHLGAGQ